MTPWQRRLLSFLAIGGGALGLSPCLVQFMKPQTAGAYIVLSIATVFYGWGVWCGLRLLEGAPSAIKACRLFWGVQIPVVQLPFLAYAFFCGTQLQILAGGSPLAFRFNANFLGASFSLAITSGGMPTLLGVNVLALAIVIFLTCKLKQISLAPQHAAATG